jgi:hypothetical protein
MAQAAPELSGLLKDVAVLTVHLEAVKAGGGGKAAPAKAAPAAKGGAAGGAAGTLDEEGALRIIQAVISGKQ